MNDRFERMAKRKPTKKFGKVKFWANRFHKYHVVPIFEDGRINIGIEAHLDRIEKAISKRNYKKKKEEAS